MMQRFQEVSKSTSKRALEGCLFNTTNELKRRSEPLLWWWNKYSAYHGLTLATTPSQTLAECNPAGVL